MKRQTFQVPNISCGHCVRTIERELQALEGVRRIAGDPGGKSVTVEWEAPADEETIRARLRAIGYPPT